MPAFPAQPTGGDMLAEKGGRSVASVAEARAQSEAASYATSIASTLPEFAGLAHEWELLNAASAATGIFNTWM